MSEDDKTQGYPPDDSSQTKEAPGFDQGTGAAPPPGRQLSTPSVVLSSTLREERMWAMFCHLAPLANFVVPIPFANIIAPLIIWLIKKDQFALVDINGKESINFQISFSIYMIGLSIIALITCGLGAVLMALAAIAAVVLVVLAAIKTNRGEEFRYPVTIRFIQ